MQPGQIRADGPFRHRAFGLTFASELAVDALPVEAGAGPADVVIRRGRVPQYGHEPGDGYGLIEGGVLLTVSGVARFLIRGGREIIVDAAPGASDRNVRLYLLGSALGAILHQRGLLPLHANAVEVDGGAVAVLGPSGAGKSTLAAWFHDQGLRVLCDDVCVVAGIDDGCPTVQPGLARLRLKPDALGRSGRAPADFEPSFDDHDKYDVPITRDGEAGAAPLRAIYLVASAQDAGEFRISALKGVDALGALVANTYRGGLIGMLGQQQRHLAQCLRLVGSRPVFAVRRSWRADRMHEENARLLSHARALGRTGDARAAFATA